VPILSAVAALGGRRRLATDLAVAGTSAWLLAKALKPIAGRARPAGALPDVVTREAIGGDLGWVSGHTAVATALGVTLAPELPPVVAPVLGVVVATVGFGRMYVGAHLPHDVVGGVGLGLVVSALASGRGPLRSGA
jgi:undecaprenyl-diphosphatase